MENNLRKNAIIDLTIDGADGEGFGVGRVNGLAVFVDGALPGERVKARVVKTKSRYAYAKMEKIITRSPDRVEPRCPVATRCGGCQWQHCAYPAQLVIKRRVVTDALVRIGGIVDPPVAEVRGMAEPFHYRNKAQFPVVADGKTAVIGFYAPRSHRVVPVEYCPIQDPAHEKILDILRAYMRRNENKGIGYDEVTHTGLLRHIVIKTAGYKGKEDTDGNDINNKDDINGNNGDNDNNGDSSRNGTRQCLVALVVNGKALPGEKALAARLTKAGVTTVLINTHTARTNVIMGERSRILAGDGYIHERIGEVVYRISAHTFFQVNSVQTKVLYDTALALAFGTAREADPPGGGDVKIKNVIDAHAGVGGVALYGARFVENVYGVEVNPEAVSEATHNAAINGINNAQFICGTAEKIIPVLLTEGSEKDEAVPLPARQVDAIFLDPPRKGCGAPLLDAIITAQIPRIVYISCDPATLSRDVKHLTASGYQLKAVQPVDMFPMTGKVECVALLTRSESACV